MKKQTTIIVLVALTIIVGLTWMGVALGNEKKALLEKLSSRELALRQTTDMATVYHIHPELAIFIDGKQVAIPHNIGVGVNGMTAIHTHDEDGVIHIEAPIKKDFVLGDFFAVWGKEFSKTRLLDTTIADTGKIAVTVNGSPVDTYENTILRDKDKIVISYQQ